MSDPIICVHDHKEYKTNGTPYPEAYYMVYMYYMVEEVWYASSRSIYGVHILYGAYVLYGVRSQWNQHSFVRSDAEQNYSYYYYYEWMAQLLWHKTSCLEPPYNSFTDMCSIPNHGKNHEFPGFLI